MEFTKQEERLLAVFKESEMTERDFVVGIFLILKQDKHVKELVDWLITNANANQSQILQYAVQIEQRGRPKEEYIIK